VKPRSIVAQAASLCYTLLLVAGTAYGQDRAVAYTHIAIETAGKAGRIEIGTLVLRGGKIEAVGANVKLPDDALVIDARGKTIMPGIVDPFHEVRITGSTIEPPAQTGVPGRRGGAFQARPNFVAGPFTRVADNFYPYDPGYRALLRSGLTSLNLVTNSYGQSAVVRDTPDVPDRMMINPDGIVFTPVTNDSASLDVVRSALDAADRARKGQAVALQTTPPTAGDATPNIPPGGRRGGGNRFGGGRPGGFAPGGGGMNAASLKAWQAVLEGKTPLFANVANAAAVVHLLKLLEPYKDVKLVLAFNGPGLYETIDLLAGRRVRVVLHPDVSTASNTRDRVVLARLLSDAGIDFAFSRRATPGDQPTAQEFGLFAVAYAVHCGLPRQTALEALTARPAAFVGLDKTHGTIEAGKTADLLIFSGDPLDSTSLLSQVLIEGRKVYEN
jgi:hypothetical protein